MHSSPPKSSRWHRIRWLGLSAGPTLAIACYAVLPERFVGQDGQLQEFTHAGRSTLALMVWMACWWMTEAIDIRATSLLPIVLLPLFGVSDIREASAPYASPIIYLFLGGFLLALSMQRWGLDHRIAIRTLGLAGTRPHRLIGGFMVATALLSSCVSNTATVAMMLPIGLSVIALFDAKALRKADSADDFSACLMLGIAYAASIGGLGTVIGSPPNGFLVQFAADELGTQITFVRWMAIGLPLVFVFLPVAWWYLTRIAFPVPREELVGGREMLARELASLGPMNRGERITLVVFLLAVVSWVVRPFALADVFPRLTDAGIAMTAGVVLFVIPVSVKSRSFVLDWDTARKMHWGILVLFGGGLSLAHAVSTHGVAQFIGSQTHHISDVPALVLMIGVTTGMIFLTELTSNTASAATIIPILCALAPGLGVEPYFLILPATLAASCAFMLPVATPPNAIVFASGRITIPQMCRAGLWLNLIAVGLITALMYAVVIPLLL